MGVVTRQDGQERNRELLAVRVRFDASGQVRHLQVADARLPEVPFWPSLRYGIAQNCPSIDPLWPRCDSCAAAPSIGADERT